MSDGILRLTVSELLDAVAARSPAPGGGAVAAVVTGLAAALTAMAGRYADPAAIPPDLVDRAEGLRAAARPLADADAAAYGSYLAATQLPRESGNRRTAVAQALSEASEVPLRIAEIAAEVAALGQRLAHDGNPNLRGDAIAGVLLAAAGASTAALLVAENLRRTPDDPRPDQAAHAAQAAQDAARDVVGEGS